MRTREVMENGFECCLGRMLRRPCVHRCSSRWTPLFFFSRPRKLPQFPENGIALARGRLRKLFVRQIGFYAEGPSFTTFIHLNFYQVMSFHVYIFHFTAPPLPSSPPPPTPRSWRRSGILRARVRRQDPRMAGRPDKRYNSLQGVHLTLSVVRCESLSTRTLPS